MHIKEIQAKYETQPYTFCTFISHQDFFFFLRTAQIFKTEAV